MGDITKTYMNIYDSSILSKANTQYSNIIETLEADLIVGDENAYFDRGKVLVAAANPDLMEFYIEPHDLVILGNRYESQLCAIEMGADCIIVCEGAGVSRTIKKIAQDRGTTVIATTYDTYTVARLINQSMPISYFMTREHLITFDSDDYIDEIKEVMASKRHRDFPILDKNGCYLGMISRRNLLGAKGKQVILVDHNEKNQAVAGVEERGDSGDHRPPPAGHGSDHGAGIFPQSAAGLYGHHYLSDVPGSGRGDRAEDCRPAVQRHYFRYAAVPFSHLHLRWMRRAARDLAEIAGLDIEKYAVQMFCRGKQS